MKIWVEGARPRTLVASVVPVLVGTAASGRLIAWRLAAALAAALATQVATNYANDYFDAVRAVDSPARQGPRRLTAAGLATPVQMRRAIAAALAVASVAGLALAAAVGLELVAVGVISFAAALAYSGGPRPYGAAGLGEPAVFIFFGVVATVGSAYVQTDRVVPEAVASSVPVGLLATAILLANNIRDAETDRPAGKLTLAVRLGQERSRRLYQALVAGSFIWLPVISLVAGSVWPLAALGALPWARVPLRLMLTRRDARGLIRALAGTARLQLVFGLLLASGLWIS